MNNVSQHLFSKCGILLYYKFLLFKERELHFSAEKHKLAVSFGISISLAKNKLISKAVCASRSRASGKKLSRTKSFQKDWLWPAALLIGPFIFRHTDAEIEKAVYNLPSDEK